jgi:hypothetical protein
MRRRPYLPVNHIPRFNLLFVIDSPVALKKVIVVAFQERQYDSTADVTFIQIPVSLLNSDIPHHLMGQQSLPTFHAGIT